MPTMQEQYDATVRHLRDQGRQSWDPVKEMCMYRAPDGCMCAIGPMIPDALYDPSMETIGVCQLAQNPELQSALLGEDGLSSLELLVALQEVHDDPRNWSENRGMTRRMLNRLRKIAMLNELSDAALDDIECVA